MGDATIPTASDIMTRRVITMRADTTAIQAMGEFVRRKISGAPVVDADGKLIGVVSEFDCLRIVASALYSHEEWEEGLPVSEFMTPDVVTVGPETDVFAITQLLVDKRIRRVPVQVDGQVVGIVSRRDVLRGVQEFQRALATPSEHRPPDKGLYLSATHEAGTEINRLLE